MLAQEVGLMIQGNISLYVCAYIDICIDVYVSIPMHLLCMCVHT